MQECSPYMVHSELLLAFVLPPFTKVPFLQEQLEKEGEQGGGGGNIKGGKSSNKEGGKGAEG